MKQEIKFFILSAVFVYPLLACPVATFGAPAAGVPGASAIQSTRLQKLDPARSSAKIRLLSALGPIDGQLKRMNGNLILNTQDFTKSIIEMEIDLSSIGIVAEPSLETLAISQLLQSIPSPIAQFKSDRIVRLANNQYRIDGYWIRKGRKQFVGVPIEITQSSGTLTVAKLKVSGDLLKSSDEISRTLPGLQKAELQSSLVFSAP